METDKIDELSLETRLSQLSSETSKHSIYKVPRQLRDVNKKAFEPQIVAIGPYYHGRDELERMEEVKLRYMQQLLNRKPDVPIKDYISAIEGMAKRARDCYAELPVNLDSADHRFIDMLVLDGCFIIQVIRRPKLYTRTFPDRSRKENLLRDLILLENQIPFFVLCKLFDLVQGPQQHKLLIENILIFCRSVFPGEIFYRDTTLRTSEEVKHILDLIHTNWTCPLGPLPDYDWITSELVDEWPRIITTTSAIVIPSASELKDANVKFLNKEYDFPPDSNIIFREGRCTTLFDVEFNDSGKMLMPTLVIGDHTESLLRNLIAYEQLFPDGRPSYVVDYMVLLDCLINTSKDVQILCRGKIIHNLLSSEEAVVDLVNKLCKGIMVDNLVYLRMFHLINVHHQKFWNRAVAALRRDYFYTPWAYIAFLGALILFLLTAAQTIFSALQL